MLFIIYLSYIFFIQPLLEARAEIQKYFCWFFGSNEKFRKISKVENVNLFKKDKNLSTYFVKVPLIWLIFQIETMQFISRMNSRTHRNSKPKSAREFCFKEKFQMPKARSSSLKLFSTLPIRSKLFESKKILVLKWHSNLYIFKFVLLVGLDTFIEVFR